MFNYRYSHLSCQCANVLKTPLHLRENSFPPLHLVVLPPYSPKNLVKRRGFSCNREPLRQKMCLHFFLFIALYQWAVSPSFARSPAQGTALPRQSVPAFPQNPADQTQEFVETPFPYAGAAPPETCVPAHCLALPSE